MKFTALEIINKIKEGKKSHEVMSTGFNKLDQLLDGGFYKKEVIILGAHTGTGKSQLAGQILYNIALNGFKTAYFSLEISNEMIFSRMAGMICDVKPSILRFGILSDSQKQDKIKAESKIMSLGDLVNFYDDIYTLKEIEKEIIQNKYEFVVIDFIQVMLSEISDEYSRLSKIAVELQKLSKQTDCTILILSQLSNTAAKEGGRSKTLEYKGSGAIAMIADLGFFLEKNVFDEEKEYDPNNGTILTLKKNRRGISGSIIKLGFQLPGGFIYEK